MLLLRKLAVGKDFVGEGRLGGLDPATAVVNSLAAVVGIARKGSGAQVRIRQKVSRGIAGLSDKNCAVDFAVAVSMLVGSDDALSNHEDDAFPGRVRVI